MPNLVFHGGNALLPQHLLGEAGRDATGQRLHSDGLTVRGQCDDYGTQGADLGFGQTAGGQSQNTVITLVGY